MACKHSRRTELGRTLRDNERMQNYDIKKDNFKTSKNALKVVRLICSSKEVE
jgi:hypothetical protein